MCTTSQVMNAKVVQGLKNHLRRMRGCHLHHSVEDLIRRMQLNRYDCAAMATEQEHGGECDCFSPANVFKIRGKISWQSCAQALSIVSFYASFLCRGADGSGSKLSNLLGQPSRCGGTRALVDGGCVAQRVGARYLGRHAVVSHRGRRVDGCPLRQQQRSAGERLWVAMSIGLPIGAFQIDEFTNPGV